ncbi:hypothetical protein [Bacillus sp. BP-3]|nr:hypothetical protein [Bacillus sp. BP-3]MDC2867541.1 hypothetical protein [Bacillus sp. BP-3]
MGDYTVGIQLLIDIAKKGDNQAIIALKEIDKILDDCETKMNIKKSDC